MMFIQSFFILTILSLGKSDDDCTSDKSEIAAIRLRKHLLCDYDKYTRPVRNHKDAVTVTIQLILKYYQYDMHDNSFTIDSWMGMRWHDEHLVWEPEEYDSIERIHLSDADIWIPDISVYNRRTQGGDQSAVEATTCEVSHDGQIICVPSISVSSICTSDLSLYPFDTHNCSVRFGSWVHSGEEIYIQIPTVAINTLDVVPNGEWKLIDTNAFRHPGVYKCCPNNTYPSVFFSFEIKRRAGAHAASTVMPALALVIITLTSLWIAPNNPQRLYLCYINLLCAFMYLEYLSFMVPLNGDKIPVLILFARDSLILVSFTIILSLILKSLVDDGKPAPEWMSKVVAVLVAFRPGQIVFLNNTPFKGFNNEQGDEDATAIVNSPSSNSRNKEWLIFAKILDRLCFFIYLVIYICVFTVFTP